MQKIALACVLAGLMSSATAADWQLLDVVETRADTSDALKLKSGAAPSANMNRFGFYSDLTYDAKTGAFYALSDRGPGGGVIDYATRVQRLQINFNPRTGRLAQPIIERTILFQKENRTLLNGLNPSLLNGDAALLGASFDPEGIAVGRGGHLYVADEYGPSLYEFTSSGHFIRAFEVPANLVPRTASGSRNYVDGRPTITTGRQDNRGYEGLALNASGNRLIAVMQDPLVNEGSGNEGRRSGNVRLVEFDVATGRATRQFVYPLEPIARLNAINPSTADDFSATQQGRSIGLSAIVALSDSEYLVLERDNRGLGVEVTAPPLHKRVYRISLKGATDVSNISLAGSNALPSGVQPVAKRHEVDVLASMRAAGMGDIPEKLEGLALGPALPDGRRLVLIGSDNDYSVTQSGSGEQFEVCVNRSTGERVANVPLDGACPAGMSRIPGFLLAFAVDFRE